MSFSPLFLLKYGRFLQPLERKADQMGGLLPPGPDLGLLSPQAAPRPALPSPNLAQAPSVDLGGVLDGQSDPSTPAGGPANTHGDLGAFLRSAGIALLSQGAPGGHLDLGQAVSQGMAGLHMDNAIMQTKRTIAALHAHYPDGNVPLPYLEQIYENAVASGNPYLAKAVQAHVQTQLEAAKVAAANKLAQGQIVYDRNGNAYRSVVTPAGEQVTIPVTVAGPDGKPVQLSRGPTQASVAPEKLGWYPDNTGQEIYGGFVADQAGVHFQPAEMGGKTMTRPAGAGGMKGVTPQMTEAAQTFPADYADIKHYLDAALPDDALGKLRVAAAGEKSRSVRMLISTPAYRAYNSARDRAAEKLAALSAGRKSNFLIQLIRDSYFPAYTDDAETKRVKMERLTLVNNVLQALYNPNIPEAQRQQIKAQVRQMILGTIGGEMTPAQKADFLGTGSSASSSGGVDLNAFDKATGGVP